MAAAGWTLSNREVASLAEIVTPDIGFVVRPAFVFACRGGSPGDRETAASSKRLRVDIGGSFGGGKTDPGVDRPVGIAGRRAHARAGDRACRPDDNETHPDRALGRCDGGRCRCRDGHRRVAADHAQRAQETQRDPVGIAAGEAGSALRAIEALDRHHIGNAEALEAVAQGVFEDLTRNARKVSWRCRPATAWWRPSRPAIHKAD